MGLYYRTYLANDPEDKKSWIHIGSKIIEQHEILRGYVSLTEMMRYLRSRDINIEIGPNAVIIETESSSLDFQPEAPYETRRLPIK